MEPRVGTFNLLRLQMEHPVLTLGAHVLDRAFEGFGLTGLTRHCVMKGFWSRVGISDASQCRRVADPVWAAGEHGTQSQSSLIRIGRSLWVIDAWS